MKQAAVLLGALSQPVRGGRVPQLGVPWRWIGAALVLATVLVPLPFMLRALWDAWQTGDWSLFWFWPGSDFQVVILMMRLDALLSQFAGNRRMRAEVSALRLRAAEGDTELVPLAAPQPAPLDGFELPAGPVVYGPLYRAANGDGAGRAVSGVMLLAFALICGIGAVVLAVAPYRGDPNPYLVAALAAGITIILGVLGCWLFIPALRRKFRSIEVTADEWGPRWRGGDGREHVIAWHDARSFSIVTYKSDTEWRPHTAYALDALDRALVWHLAPTANQEQREISDRLVRLIATRTHLPLRDLSRSLTAIGDGESLPGGARSSVTTLSATQPALLPPLTVTPVLPVSLVPGLSTLKPRSLRSGCVTGCLVWLVALLLLGLVSGTGWLLQRQQPDYLASLPARVHAERPLFQDSMTDVNYLWPLQVVTKDFPGSMRYANGGYELTGSKAGTFMDAMTTPLYGDIAVEVTARQMGKADMDGVGLVVSGDADGFDLLVFNVSPSQGTWWLGRHHFEQDDWSFLEYGTPSDAIRTGDNAANRLLIIMHGGTYVCYINGQLVGTVTDPLYTSTPGHVGVYLNNGATAGIFDDFAVYPAQPASSFFYV